MAADQQQQDARVDQWLTALAAERPTLEAASRQAENERTLPTNIVELLRELGLFWLKTPESLGGTELSPPDFAVILEELAYMDASAAWAVMVGNGTTGSIAGWLPDAGIADVFSSSRLPIFAGQFVPSGAATSVPGGYRVTGRWSFCSGIEHADWLAGTCKVDDDGSQIVISVPKAATTRHDTWHVAGLQGTGSGDFSLEDAFIPSEHTFGWPADPAARGGPLFRQPHVMFVANELSPVAVGIARRALDDMLDIASATSRKGSAARLGDRAVFQREIARSAAIVHSLQLLYQEVVSRNWEETLSGVEFDGTLITTMLAEHTYVVETCADVVARIFRYGGGRVLALSHPMQRHLRNLTAAAQHVFVSDENYEAAGKLRIQAREQLTSNQRGS